MNIFDHRRIAEGYANDRPSYHCTIMEKVRKELRMLKNFEYGLDVGCGSGSSTSALRNMCNNVIGIEESTEMLRVAKLEHVQEDISFMKCKAEQAFFRDDLFDIVTASGSINWIDPYTFLPLMKKQIKRDGWLVIYDHYFTGRLADSESFSEWYNGKYLMRFPKPPRNEQPWDDGLIRPYGFCGLKQEEYSHSVIMNRQEFIAFIVTQSNVISAVEQSGVPLQEVRDWLNEELVPVFGSERRKLIFGGYIWYIKNMRAE